VPGLPTRGPHCFVDLARLDGDEVVLGGDEAHHLATVLRVRPGHPVSIGDGAGTAWQAEVVSAARAEVRVRLTERHDVPAPAPRLTVVHALPKGRKLDGVVQALTEIGVDRIVPVASARSETRLDGERAAKALRRWRAIAVAAARQSRRAWLPEVASLGSWTSVFAGAACGAVLWESAASPLGAVIERCSRDDIVLGVGPEGGLTDSEVHATGLPAATLGPTILRTEHAALAAAAIVLDRAGRLS
jgi:16S rRNA (uracil1498-N3)-methyltransferase